jgi:hypothetical protein
MDEIFCQFDHAMAATHSMTGRKKKSGLLIYGTPHPLIAPQSAKYGFACKLLLNRDTGRRKVQGCIAGNRCPKTTNHIYGFQRLIPKTRSTASTLVKRHLQNLDQTQAMSTKRHTSILPSSSHINHPYWNQNPSVGWTFHYRTSLRTDNDSKPT